MSYQLPDAPPPPKLPPAAAEPAAVARTAARAATAGIRAAVTATRPAASPAAAARRRRCDAVAEHHEDRRDHAREHSRQQGAEQVPGDQGYQPAGRGRADQPAQRGPHQAAEQQHRDDEKRVERIDAERPRALPVWRFRRRQLLTVDHPDHPVDARGDASGEIAGLESWRDVFVDNALGGGVGETALQAVPDFDTQMTVVLGNDKERAVVDLLAPDLPGFRNPDRILLDGFRRSRRHDQHRDLAALPGFQRFKGLRQRGDIVA